MKKAVRGLLMCLALCWMLTLWASATPVETGNLNDYNYTYDRYANPIKSHLLDNGDGTFTRVEYTGKVVTVELYDSSYQYISGQSIQPELPVYGGFFSGTDSYFLIFGQENPTEDDNAEVMRVIRYTKDWKRVGAAGLYGGHTTIPFDAGTLRCCEYNGYLYVRTCHEMYAHNGVNHQANLTVNVRIADMVVTDIQNVVHASEGGYVSHSFNQFIATANGQLFAVDQGDAYPRSVVLFRYYAPAGQDSFTETKNGQCAQSVNILPVGGEFGDNDTGIALGGFEISETACLVAGNTIDQDAAFDPDGPRNVFVCATDLDDFTDQGTQIHYLTAYTEEDAVELSVPHFVKIEENRYAVLWTETVYPQKSLRWVYVDGSGAPVSEIYSATGVLSDCRPLVCDGKILWYVTGGSAPVFLTIDLQTQECVYTDHIYSYSYSTRPTYSTEGSLSSSCVICKKSGARVTVPAVKDSGEYSIYSVSVAPTCTTNGEGYYRWDKSPMYDVSYRDIGGVIPALGHDFERVTAEPTCTQPGSVTKTCATCGFVETEILPPLGHDSGDAQIAPPTCTEPGGCDYTCVICGQYVDTPVPPKGHHYESSITAPACDQQGYTTYTCSVCADSYRDHFVDGPGHEYGFVSSMSATCLGNGYEKGTCSICGYTYRITLPALGHSYDGVVTPPTCTQEGYTTYTCVNNRCTSTYVSDTVPALGHAFETVTVKATCTQEGTATDTCSLCGDMQIRILPALGHSYVDGICGTCGDVQLIGQGQCGTNLFWKLDARGTLTVSGTGVMWMFSESSPAPWSGLEVRNAVLEDGVEDIGAFAFYQCESLDTVSVPETVEAIGISAFAYCSSLQDVKLPEKLSYIGQSAFFYSGLTQLTVPEGITVIPELMVSYCMHLTKVELPSTLQRIDNYAFDYCTNLAEITIPDTVTSLGISAFGFCRSLQSLYIPDSVQTIDGWAFAECTNLISIRLPQGLTEISDYMMQRCLRLQSIEIPKTVTRIGREAFRNCEQLQTLLVPGNVTMIDEQAFQSCKKLSQLTMERGVRKICVKAFEKCTALKQIEFPATLSTIEQNAFGNCTGVQQLYFTGNAPSIGYEAFENVSATAWYSSKTYGWAEYVFQDYGGTLLWKNSAITVPVLALKYPSVSFEDEVIMNVYYAAEDLQDVVEMGLVVYNENIAEGSIATADAVVPGYEFVTEEGFYCAHTNGIAPKRLGDTLYFAVYAKLTDGTYIYTKVVSYSPSTYAYAQLNSGIAKMKPLVVAMLNYGAEAQKFFNYNTENLVNAKLTEEQKTLVVDYSSDLMTTIPTLSAGKEGRFAANGGFVRRYPTISFEGAFAINYYCTPEKKPADGITLYVWNEADFTAVDVLTTDNATEAIRMDGSETGEYLAVVDGIAAKYLDQGVYVAFVYSDGTTNYSTGVLAYSIGTYCNTVASGNGSQAALAKATAVYGYYAKNLLI